MKFCSIAPDCADHLILCSPGASGDANLYRYAFNQPLVLVDSGGEFAIALAVPAVAVVAVALVVVQVLIAVVVGIMLGILIFKFVRWVTAPPAQQPARAPG